MCPKRNCNPKRVECVSFIYPMCENYRVFIVVRCVKIIGYLLSSLVVLYTLKSTSQVPNVFTIYFRPCTRCICVLRRGRKRRQASSVPYAQKANYIYVECCCDNVHKKKRPMIGESPEKYNNLFIFVPVRCLWYQTQDASFSSCR